MQEQKESVGLGTRHNEGKLNWSLVDFKSFEPMVKVLMFGAKKYAPHNWKKGLKVSETIDSLMRHLIELNEGKDLDNESKLEIIGHIQCNVMFLSYMLHNYPELDDRYKDPNYNKTSEVIIDTDKLSNVSSSSAGYEAYFKTPNYTVHNEPKSY